MSSIRHQVNALFIPTLEDLKVQGAKLKQLLSEQYPPVAAPRAPIRYVTKRLGVSWTAAGDTGPVTFHSTDRGTFYPVNEGAFLQKLLEDCTNPRLSYRALSRLDSFTRWLNNREEGIIRASANILSTQRSWVDKLNARIACVELGEKYKPLTQDEQDKIRGAMLRGNKYEVTSHLRSYGVELITATAHVDAAQRMLAKKGFCYIRVGNQLVEIIKT